VSAKTSAKKRKSIPVLLGLRAYARHRGCAPSSVEEAVAAGRIKRDPGGLFDRDQCDRDWKANTRHAGAEKPAEISAEPVSTGGLKPPDYNESRARSEAARADRLELDNRVRCGELIEVAAVVPLIDLIAQVINEGHEQVCARFPDEVAVEENPRLIRKRLKEELHGVQHRLADAVRQFQKSLKRPAA